MIIRTSIDRVPDPPKETYTYSEALKEEGLYQYMIGRDLVRKEYILSFGSVLYLINQLGLHPMVDKTWSKVKYVKSPKGTEVVVTFREE